MIGYFAVWEKLFSLPTLCMTDVGLLCHDHSYHLVIYILCTCDLQLVLFMYSLIVGSSLP